MEKKVDNSRGSRNRQSRREGRAGQNGWNKQDNREEQNRQDRRDSQNSRNRIWKAACVMFLAGALICTGVACAQKEQQSEAEDEYEQLSEMTKITEPPATPEPTQQPSSEEASKTEAEEPDILTALGVPVPEKAVDFEELQENTNKDIYAWIYIPDTMIDYPVLQHPTDNTYYLNYNLDGSRGYPGCIYTEDYNAKDFSDPLTVMYGHNMKNGTMFAGLHRYSDIAYMESHPYVYIYTEEGELLVYEIFASYEYTNEHLLYNRDYTDGETFERYIENVKGIRDMSMVMREEVEVTAEDRILTMSTCISSKPNNRFLVQGVLLNGE